MKDRDKKEALIRLKPALKDYLWGGSKLNEVFHKISDSDRVAESWELSAHPEGESIIASGKYEGFTFLEYLNKKGPSVLGNNCKNMDKFPILIKLIDAKKPLSLQVHPDDDYALKVEGELGKNEMWYVVSAAKDAYIYYGLSKEVSKEEIKERIADNTIFDILGKTKVKAGDTFFVQAGTIHAIGQGVLACEIQESSDATYRIYDYDRRDKNGNLRQLHIDKALDVIDIPLNVEEAKRGAVRSRSQIDKSRLYQGKYFTADLYKSKGIERVEVNEDSFVAIVILEGQGKISLNNQEESMPFNIGDTFFITAGNREILIDGSAKFLSVKV